MRSWPVGRFTVEWIQVDTSELTALPMPDRVGLTSYFRMLIPRLLPGDVERAIYLDCDVVVCADLARLWEQELSGHLCLAAQDPSAPYIDADHGLPDGGGCVTHIGHRRPIANYRALGLDPCASYFNAGVMLIDVNGWRHANLTKQLFSCLTNNREHVLWWDQYALNVVLSGRWGHLDPRWNQGAHIFKYPSWEQSPFDRTTFDEQRHDPFIVHFTTSKKPWLAACRHPLRHPVHAVRSRTS